MSRKWERMVQRNADRLNRQRKKRGKPGIEVGKSNVDVYRGRSVFLPIIFLAVSVFLVSVPSESVTLQWVTAILYFLMALYFFFKRPYLAVGRSGVAVRRLGREKWVSADQIAEIHAGKGTTLIVLKMRKTRWSFTRWLNGYPTDEMNARLKLFAAQHGIPYHE
jgi:hypothetical protein